ncbi:hypothetical protein [Cohnella sp. REN36]|uniref:hypothetical protein n=1 Tax=Cohnella sp. REN36 TaxID=2887347 RepID=UPI001D137D2B|nr:hypothetical protein [Cohnella sp. REN36]MCC3372144.1 hypothetical protein [Cohnella sp. REN36]
MKKRLHADEVNLSSKTSAPLSLDELRNRFERCEDIVFHPVEMSDVRGCLVYFIDLVSAKALKDIQSVLITMNSESDSASRSPAQLLHALQTRFLLGRAVPNSPAIINEILSGLVSASEGMGARVSSLVMGYIQERTSHSCKMSLQLTGNFHPIRNCPPPF